MDKALWKEVLNNLKEIANALRGQVTTDEQVRLESHPEMPKQEDSNDDDD
jgi:hypothetical protein